MPNWKKLIVSGSDASLNKLTVSTHVTASDLQITDTGSIDYLEINDRLQGNGSGFQFFSFNEDTAKVKFVNWYGSNDNQYGMGMLWYETWFAAIDTDGDANDIHRRIGFYLEQPEAGATDSTSGNTGRHSNNSRFYVDVTGSYVASGSLFVTDADFTVSSSGDVEINGDLTVSDSITSNGSKILSQSGDFVNNEFLIAVGKSGVTSSDAMAVDDDGNLGIGISDPEVRLHMVGDGPQTSQIRMEQYNDTSDAPDIRTRRGRGTYASKSDVQTGDYLFRLNVEGRKGDADVGYASLQFDVDGSDADAINYKLTSRDTAGNSSVRHLIDGNGDTQITGSLDVSGTITGDGSGLTGITVANNAITHAKYQQVATNTIIGRTTTGTGNVTALTAADVRGIINVENGATADQTGAEIATALNNTDVDLGTGDLTAADITSTNFTINNTLTAPTITGSL